MLVFKMLIQRLFWSKQMINDKIPVTFETIFERTNKVSIDLTSKSSMSFVLFIKLI